MAQSSKNSSHDEHEQVWQYLLWALAAGTWVLIASSLISYDAADWPGRFIAPHNEHASNWIGHVGAWLSDELYSMVGPGGWIFMVGCLALLVAMAQRKRISQPALRAIGLALMSLAASALIGLMFTGSGEHPLGRGGLVAAYVNRQLVVRFSMIGTLVILMIGFWVGAILAMDQWLAAMGRVVVSMSYALASRIDVITPVLVGKLPGLALIGAGISRWSLKSKVPIRAGGRLLRPHRHEPATTTEEEQTGGVDPDAGGLGATKSFGTDRSDDDKQVSKKRNKRFSADELRAKIKQLPINLAMKGTGSKVPPPREMDLSGYRFPEMGLLEESEIDFTVDMELSVRDQAVQLESALQQYRIEGEVVGIDSGPVITLYEVRLAPGTKVAQLNAISSDIARGLKAHNVRIVPNMAGKDTVGIEVPNLKKQLVRLKDLMTVDADQAARMKLPMWLGKDASGKPLIADLAAMPHMLIAGTTGSGKSVCMNSILMSFLFTKRPDELKLVLVDPKMVEMAMFRDLPHLLCSVVTEMPKAAAILEWATAKMDERYELLAEAGVRDITGYNKLTWEEIRERMGPTNEAEEARIPRKLPFLVFMVDELADLMMTAKEVEGFIVRLAQKSRAVGMHLILATQRPQANVVTGLIKSNMPCRVSFKVASGMDSRIVLDHKGAELLLGQGDMLYLSPRTSKITRAQGTMVDDGEISRCVKFIKKVAEPSFEPQLVQIKSLGMSDEVADRDPLFDKAVEVVLETRRGSVSLLQRRLTIGYSRASRLIEQMAQSGIIGAYKGSQAREVQLSIEEWKALKAQAQADAQGDADVEEKEDVEDEYEEQDIEVEVEEEVDEQEEEEGEKEEDDKEYEYEYEEESTK